MLIPEGMAKGKPPFGSTDIIECNKQAQAEAIRAYEPPFGSTDIIECNLLFGVDQQSGVEPPFGSTDIVECNTNTEKTCLTARNRHSVALISSSATRRKTEPSLRYHRPPFGSTDIIECNGRHTESMARW